MISLNELGMTYGQKLLFYDVKLNLNDHQAYALVGANGSGKSTFFKLITGEEEPSAGDIIIPKDATIGWLKQDQFRYENTPLIDVVLQGKQPLWAALQEKEALLSIDSWDERQAARFSHLEEIILHHDGYAATSEIEHILIGLGIPKTSHLKPLKQLSGGFKLRVLLAQTLFQRPSILLLDEPTNHLDIESIQWLEKFLKTSFKGLVPFISHDLEFIDHVAEHILDIDYGEIRKYPGKYEKFLAEKQLLAEQKEIAKKSAEEKIAHLQKFVDRFKAKASKASLARSRMKMIDKIEVPDLVHSSRIAPSFQFVPQRPSGKLVCKLRDVDKAFKDKPLFKQLNIQINRQDKMAIMGINGRGKSTLIKLLMGLTPPDKGTIEWGSEVKISYFSQDHHESLTESTSVLKWLNEIVPSATEQQVRRVLGQLLFSKGDVDKNILTLSGGEAARVLLAKVILECPNVIILDEPTNHLDIETIDVLAKALAEYTGTLILVSHNRYFIEKTATRVLYLLDNQRVDDFKGNYEAYLSDQ